MPPPPRPGRTKKGLGSLDLDRIKGYGTSVEVPRSFRKRLLIYTMSLLQFTQKASQGTPLSLCLSPLYVCLLTDINNAI